MLCEVLILTSLLDYDYNKCFLSKRGQKIVDLVSGSPLTWGQTVAVCREIGFLPREERGAVFVVLKRLLSPDAYSQIHQHYIKYTLGHRWGA